MITVGLDLAKTVFAASGASSIQLHGADGAGRALSRKKPRRDQVLAFLSQRPPCVVAMEACGGAHFRGRETGKLGHEVRRIPPAWLKPFIKRHVHPAAWPGTWLGGMLTHKPPIAFRVFLESEFEPFSFEFRYLIIPHKPETLQAAGGAGLLMQTGYHTGFTR